MRLDIELTTIDPNGELAYLEGRGADGQQLGLYLRAPALAQLGALAPGQRLTLTLEPAPASVPSLRERMAGPAAPRLAATPAPAPAPARAAPPRVEQTAAILAAVLGPPRRGAEPIRDVDDEMDALFGRKKDGR